MRRDRRSDAYGQTASSKGDKRYCVWTVRRESRGNMYGQTVKLERRGDRGGLARGATSP